MKKILITWILLFAIALSMAGCTKEIPQATLSSEAPKTEGLTLELLSALSRETKEAKAADTDLSYSMAAFSLSLLQNSHTVGNNTILSPYSMYMALAMATNGAQGQTLAQMEALLGMPIETLNPYIPSLQSSAGEEVSEANSLWLHEKLPVEETYLQTLRNYYEAQVYTTPFDDHTLEAMNGWIEEQTAGRIPRALDQMHPNAMMYLINALSFDAVWETVYNPENIGVQPFFSPSGTQSVEMMSSKENLYLSCGRATGFMKDYEGGRYSFLALLPNDGVSLEDYLASLTPVDLLYAVENAEACPVMATMPKLSLDTSVEMKSILQAMGMVDAFGMEADFSGMEAGKNLFISRILHKTHLQIDETGTEAGAVTVEEIVYKGFDPNQKFVFLNRPYLMGIYDKVNGCFLFLGTVSNP